MTLWGVAGTAYLMASINDIVSCGLSFFLGSRAGEWREKKKRKKRTTINSAASIYHLKQKEVNASVWNAPLNVVCRRIRKHVGLRIAGTRPDLRSQNSPL